MKKYPACKELNRSPDLSAVQIERSWSIKSIGKKVLKIDYFHYS